MKLKYDRDGRLRYHPDFHHRQHRKYTLEELEYLCKFYDVDGAETIGLALGRTATSIMSKVKSLKATGEYEFYKGVNMFYTPIKKRA